MSPGAERRRLMLGALLTCLLVDACSRPDRTDSQGLAGQGVPPPPAVAAKPKGRLFRPQDLGLLEGPDRDQWQKPDLIMDALRIAEGSVVADVGAGSGWFTIQLSRRVGQSGIVYAEDIQPQMVEEIRSRVQREGLANVRPILGAADDPRLPSGIDAILIVDAYHEMEDPTEPAQITGMLGTLARSLKPQGRIGIVDFAAGGGGPGPPAEERVNPAGIIRAAAAAGLQLIAQEAVPPFQFLLVFGRSVAPRGSL